MAFLNQCSSSSRRSFEAKYEHKRLQIEKVYKSKNQLIKQAIHNIESKRKGTLTLTLTAKNDNNNMVSPLEMNICDMGFESRFN